MSMQKEDMTDVRIFAPRLIHNESSGIKAAGIKTHDIKIVDIHVPFFSMVALMFKGIFALILAVIFAVIVQWLFVLIVGFPVLGGLMGFGL